MRMVMTQSNPGRFSVRRPFVLPVTVRHADIDAQGHASNVAVLAWMNEAAIAHSAALGYDAAAYRQAGGFFVVKRHEIDYLRPARLGDELLCATWPSLMRGATAQRRHEIVRRSDGELIARGVNTWAFVDVTSGRPTRVPAAILSAFDPERFI